jgi:hypothetical protein
MGVGLNLVNLVNPVYFYFEVIGVYRRSSAANLSWSRLCSYLCSSVFICGCCDVPSFYSRLSAFICGSISDSLGVLAVQLFLILSFYFSVLSVFSVARN